MPSQYLGGLVTAGLIGVISRDSRATALFRSIAGAIVETAGTATADFQREIDFWLKRVGKASPQWPLELCPEK